MKRYIKSSKTRAVDIDTSMFKGTPFQCKTGMSRYDEFLNIKDLTYNQNNKNRTGSIVMMSPEDYYWNCSMYGLPHYTPVSQLKLTRRADAEDIERIKNDMQNGVKYHLCVLNKADRTHEGLHRMMAAGDAFGWNTLFPVLVVEPYDMELEAKWKMIDAAEEFRDDRFKNWCSRASHKISAWDKPVPENFKELYREAIFDIFKDSFEYKVKDITDIDFDIDIQDVEDHPRVEVYLTKYNDYEFPDRYDPFEVWLEDLYDVTGQYQDKTPSDIDDLDMLLLDLDDKSITDMFFRDNSAE